MTKQLQDAWIVAATRTVFGLESYVGLVEAGVGLLPAGGGLKEFAVRASDAAGPGGDVFAQLKTAFESVAMAKVSTSAMEAKSLKLARDNDTVVFNPHELLHVAKAQALALDESGYRPPMKALFPVAGRSGIATIKGQVANMRDGGFVSAHDYALAAAIADVVCGGEVEAGSLVSEEYLMALERKHFCALLDNPKTQERIMGMLQTGKPVRN